MCLKSFVILILALVVINQAAVINLQPIDGEFEYELFIGESASDVVPMAVHIVRERRDTKADKGSVSGDVSRGPGGTTTVTAEGKKNIYTSPNGKTTVDAHGQYERTYGKPHSKPNYNYGVGFKHRF